MKLWILALPFCLQALVMTFDEFYFHLKRGLPVWERVGHPLDTLLFLSSILFIQLVPYSAIHLKEYVAIALISSFFITKDEFVHFKNCPPGELWMHSLLFVLHPITLLANAMIWILNAPSFWHSFLIFQTASITLFLLYQFIYWNFLWKPQQS
jgi:hypothetical protein